MNTFDSLRILDFVYREWFCNHDRDTEVSFSRLFGKFSRFYPSCEFDGSDAVRTDENA